MPALPQACQNWVLVNDGDHDTGFPVATADGQSITLTDRFPVPPGAKPKFHLPALRYEQQGPAITSVRTLRPEPRQLTAD